LSIWSLLVEVGVVVVLPVAVVVQADSVQELDWLLQQELLTQLPWVAVVLASLEQLGLMVLIQCLAPLHLLPVVEAGVHILRRQLLDKMEVPAAVEVL
jgi:hypothetical protein